LCVLLCLLLLIDAINDSANDNEGDGTADTATDGAALVCLGALKQPVVVIFTIDRAILTRRVSVGIPSIDIGRQTVVTAGGWAAEGPGIIIGS
jgi:hypothetical protein